MKNELTKEWKENLIYFKRMHKFFVGANLGFLLGLLSLLTISLLVTTMFFWGSYSQSYAEILKGRILFGGIDLVTSFIINGTIIELPFAIYLLAIIIKEK